MGVIRNKSSHNNSRDSESQLIEDIFDNIVENDDEDDHNAINDMLNDARAVRRAHRNRTRSGRTLRPEPTYRGLGVRGKSHKKRRRYENANLLPREYETLSDGEELNDISIYDFIPQTVSVFAQLLMEKENMRAWNELINCTEEEQSQLLRNIKKNRDSNHANNNGKESTEKLDNRKNGVAFSADECFKRIDADLKNMLRKKHIPLGVLAAIEEEIGNFFNDNPLEIYKSCLSSGFQRLLLHACCQYMDLTCQSFNENGERWSKVRNRNDFFAKPNIMLTNYLELLHGHYYRRSHSLQ